MNAGALHKLEIEADKCKRCQLHKTRTNVVFGVGPSTAEVMLVGEGPGFTEDQTKIPFSGYAGKFLNELLHEAGLKRDGVRITNVVLCRPPQNRSPLPDEIEACRPFLEGQISSIEPKLVVALGRTAARTLLARHVSMGEGHGKLVECAYAGVRFKLFLTYHPAAARYGFKVRSRLVTDFRELGRLLKRLKISSNR